MLKKVVDFIEDSDPTINDGTFFCSKKILRNDIAVLRYLETNSCIEQSLYLDDIEENEIKDIELSIDKLSKIGFYDNCNSFIQQNKYNAPSDSFYIYETKQYNTSENNIFNKQYTCVLKLIKSIQSVEKHTFSDCNITKSVISNGEKSVIVSFDYTDDIRSLDSTSLSYIENISDVLCGEKNEKHNLFLNELINYIHDSSTDSFSFLLKQIKELYNNSNNAFSFYISNYSSNKLKFEIDSKAIEYTQKIQNIINDVQTRLIAIPSAFVLASLAMDFEVNKSLSVKNIVTILSLYIFSILIQMFINNQKNSLSFIETSLNEFKKSFDSKPLPPLNDRFKIVNETLVTQKKRLDIIQFILWIIPVLLTFYISSIYISNNKNIISLLKFLII